VVRASEIVDEQFDGGIDEVVSLLLVDVRQVLARGRFR
jgi:hypothetical protein